ncbi:MAG: 50S ribosomal protein L11 methyltransferase [Pseudomonadota bacterium]
MSKWWTGGLSPIDVGDSLRIVPFWDSWRTEPDRLNLVIDPGASFGSGDHPTTLIALELLEKTISQIHNVQKPLSLFDIGTGTGVLAIAAQALGCEFIVACDLDPSAIWLAKRNIALNENLRSEAHNRRPHFYVGPLDAVQHTFDLVVANLAAPVLKRLKKELIARSGRYLILSGIPDSMFDLIQEEFSDEKTNIEDAFRISEWNGLVFRKNV